MGSTHSLFFDKHRRILSNTICKDASSCSLPISETPLWLFIIGPTAAGKTTLLNQHGELYEKNPGVFASRKTIEIESKEYELHLYDSNSGCWLKKGGHGVILMFDLTDRDSFACARSKFLDISQYACERVQVWFVGNKKDLEDERVVSSDEAMDFALENGLEYREISALYGMGIDECLKDLTVSIVSTMY
eukprot:TRINITY_DN1008_c0_g1_i1.p1 TRINITY_DN1008_c0_g1~~TRINITY_DN1008_c0_g1_i1.p1  ORF type:complete len:190 (+),score=26.60 TRINITY_DN1008_c0_g1_i1:83-652(+)